MAGKRKVHTAAFKAQVALAALKGDRTVNELAGHYGVHPTLIHGWKKQLLTGAEGLFGSPAQAASADAEARQAELFEQIGRLKMELEWVKKKALPQNLWKRERPLREGIASPGTPRSRWSYHASSRPGVPQGCEFRRSSIVSRSSSRSSTARPTSRTSPAD